MKKMNRILFVCESDHCDNAALEQAIELARSQMAELTVIGCFDNLKKLSQDQPSHKILIQEMLNHKQAELKQYIKNLTSDEIQVKVFLGKPFIDIIQEVIEFDIDLVIKAVNPSGFKSIIFGSQDLKLLRFCPCPLWLIKPTESKPEKKIIVAIDYEPDNPENEMLNKQLLDMGVSLALSQFAELHVVHAWSLDNESFLRSPRMEYTDKEVDAMLQQEQEQRSQWLKDTVDTSVLTHGKQTHTFLSPVLHLIKGSAAHNIPQLVKKTNPELLIMGTVGRTGIPGFFIGNTAEAILFDVNCSVLALKPEAFVSPVKLEA